MPPRSYPQRSIPGPRTDRIPCRRSTELAVLADRERTGSACNHLFRSVGSPATSQLTTASIKGDLNAPIRQHLHGAALSNGVINISHDHGGWSLTLVTTDGIMHFDARFRDKMTCGTRISSVSGERPSSRSRSQSRAFGLVTDNGGLAGNIQAVRTQYHTISPALASLVHQCISL